MLPGLMLNHAGLSQAKQCHNIQSIISHHLVFVSLHLVVEHLRALTQGKGVHTF